MYPEFTLEQVETSSTGIYFVITKDTEADHFELNFDNDVLYPILATALGWDGEPHEYDEAAFYLQALCPMDMAFVGVVDFWNELGGEEVEAQQRAEEEEE